ncbi:hypothetical protein ACQBAU_05205 [Propionibacteriaceae bacterium Y2011]
MPENSGVVQQVRVHLERADAHPGDQHGLSQVIDVPGTIVLSDLLDTVLMPFLSNTPRAVWVCRARTGEGWQDLAEVIIEYGEESHLSARLLVADQPMTSLLAAGQTAVGLFCRNQWGRT